MKKHLCLLALAILCLFVNSCKKNSGSDNTSGSGNLIRIQQGFGAADTVYILTYDTQNRINSIIDSLSKDTLVASYNGYNQLTDIVEHGHYKDHISYTYNAGGQLTRAEDTIGGEHDRLDLIYASSVLALMAYSTDFGYGGPLQSSEIDSVSVSGGNITDIKIYSTNGGGMTYQQEQKITYATQPNTFKTLALFNCENLLGMQEILEGNLASFYNKNIISSITSYDLTYPFFFITTVPKFNEAQSPNSMVTTEFDIQSNITNTYTWNFSYK